jgi:hypothetical protein
VSFVVYEIRTHPDFCRQLGVHLATDDHESEDVLPV